MNFDKIRDGPLGVWRRFALSESFPVCYFSPKSENSQPALFSDHRREFSESGQARHVQLASVLSGGVVDQTKVDRQDAGLMDTESA